MFPAPATLLFEPAMQDIHDHEPPVGGDVLYEEAPKLVRRSAGREIAVGKLIRDAAEGGLWLVAWDRGSYELLVGNRSIGVEVVEEESIKLVLSHRWSPSIATSIGRVPLAMMASAYPEPTWVDFLNHWNCQDFAPRVLEQMGRLYAEKPCRALYFEGKLGFEDMAEACSRCWMWQELSIGPQRHSYSCAEAVWLHFAVQIGDLYRAWEVCFRLWDPVQSFPANILDRMARGRIDAEGVTVAMQSAWRSGRLAAVLSTVLKEHGAQRLAKVLLREVGEDAPMAAGLAEAARSLRAVYILVAKCSDAVCRARRVDNVALTETVRSFKGLSWLARLAGSRSASLEFHVAAKDVLLQIASHRSGETELPSAVSNLANRNVSVDADRLVASFGVLCAEEGARCEPAEISAMIKGQGDTRVECLWEGESMGLGAATRRRVEVQRGGKEVRQLTARTALIGAWSLVSCRKWISIVEVDAVFVSGLALGPCEVRTTTSCSALLQRGEGAGVVVSYSLLNGCLQNLEVLLDNGLHCGLTGSTDGATAIPDELDVSEQEFWTWWEGLEVANSSAWQ